MNAFHTDEGLLRHLFLLFSQFFLLFIYFNPLFYFVKFVLSERLVVFFYDQVAQIIVTSEHNFKFMKFVRHVVIAVPDNFRLLSLHIK